MEVTLIFPHQLFSPHPSISRRRQIFIIEDPLFFRDDEFPLKFHKQKILLHQLSIDNYYKTLKNDSYDVRVISYKSFGDKEYLKKIFIENSINKIFYADLHDYELNKRLNQITKELKIKSVIYETPGFLLGLDQVQEDFKGKNKFMMAQFYQKQRRRFNVLIDSNQKPIGGKWSFDAENRKRLPKNLEIPAINSFIKKEKLNNKLKDDINLNFSLNPGNLNNFNYAVSHEEAKISFEQFLNERFMYFGDYEDAISINEPYIFHSVLTPALNIGLITPNQVLQSTLDYAKEFEIPLNSLEGFIRQIIGWREYIRAVYHIKGCEQRTTNFWNFSKKIPESFYNATTGIKPVDDIINNINNNAYAHHIERLMILGNIMCLMRINPNEVYRWFMEMFIDSYDWVMVPNVYGMSQFADGGIMSTKPYISGSNYILKMSNYKKESWCELWDALYWRFIDDHRDFFSKNYRMKMMVSLYDKKDESIKNNYIKLYNSI
ncbi:MAG: cryptochrome/photolyase family protein [Fidelibacterota bacterium]|jgi:deoxyribodipyrimidine photolyase-related protein